VRRERKAAETAPWALVGVVCAATCWAAATPWLAAYRIAGVPWILAAAAAVAPAVPIIAVVGWQRGPAVTYPLSVAALMALLVAAVSARPADLARGLVSGPSHLLTDTLPLTTPRWLMVPAVVITWLTGAAAGEILARKRAAGPVLAVVGGCFLVSYAASSGSPGLTAASGAGLVVAGGLLALIVGEINRSPLRPAAAPGAGGGTGPGAGEGEGRWSRGRRALGGVVLAAGVAAASGGIVPHLPGMGGHGRTLERRPPTVDPVATSPVDVMAAMRDDNPLAPATPLLTVRSTGGWDGYLPVAVLDTYDGDTWSFDATFRPTGGRVPSPPVGEPPAGGHVFAVDIRLLRPLAPSLPLIPYPDRPVRVTGLGVDEDAATGMVVPAEGLETPVGYQVEARAPEATLSQLPAAATLDLATAAADRQLGATTATDLIPTLRYLANLTGVRPAPDTAFLRALAGALYRDDRRVDPQLTAASGAPPTRGGTSLAEVVSAITVSQEATPEQFATLFAVVARDLGVPARLVTGFRVASPGHDGVGPGPYTVTNRQAWTWAEVPVAGEGWVVVDPTPPLTTGAAAPPPVAAVTSPSTTVAPANAVPNNAPGTHALAPAPRFAPTRRPAPLPFPVVVVLGILAVAVLLAAAAGGQAAVRRSWRRRSRRGGDPRAGVVGAWLEVLDALYRAGFSADPWETPREIADRAAAVFGPALHAPVRAVGALADRALCSPGWKVDANAAGEAWELARLLPGRLVAHRSASDRVRGWLRVGTQPRRPEVRLGRRGTGPVPAPERASSDGDSGPGPAPAPLVEAGSR
jgi:transglutaminase-like putative cysteine protease